MSQGPLRLAWGDDRAVEVTSAEELDRELDRLQQQAADRPVVVALEHESGAVLTLGVGRDESVVNFGAGKDPPYYTSRSAAGAAREGVVVFFYWGHWTEFPASAAVPIAAAREAARRFERDGRRPSNLEWTLD